MVAATLMLAACGDASTEATGPRSRPTGGGEVVVQVMVAGGFVPVDMAVTAVPTLTVLGDGTVITQAPVTAVFPGPAIVPLQAATASAEAVDGLVRRARQLGLLDGPLDFGRPPVADAPDTTVTIVADGRTHTQTAYALGVGAGIDEGPGRGFSARPLVGEREQANRRALAAFLAATQKLPAGDRSWPPEAVAVYALGEYQPDPELPQAPLAWPLARPPALAGERLGCTVFEGAEASSLLGALGRANSRTPWMVGGRARSLAFRPIVPGQPGCPGA